MREIKFRGRRTYDKKWIYGNLVIDEGKYKHIVPFDKFIEYGHHLEYDNETGEPVFFDEETIGQYIGLCDDTDEKNNLYSGDIISYENPNLDEMYTGVIKYNEEWCCFAIFDKYTDKYEHESDWKKIKNIKKIGNIFDNPELLMEEK